MCRLPPTLGSTYSCLAQASRQRPTSAPRWPAKSCADTTCKPCRTQSLAAHGRQRRKDKCELDSHVGQQAQEPEGTANTRLARMLVSALVLRRARVARVAHQSWFPPVVRLQLRPACSKLLSSQVSALKIQSGLCSSRQRCCLTRRSTGHIAACQAWPSFHSGPSLARHNVPVTSNVRPRRVLTTLSLRSSVIVRTLCI